MGNFDEAKHPRDEQGRFTLKGGVSQSVINDDLEKEKMERRADILYPSMKDIVRKNTQFYFDNIGLGLGTNYNIEDIMFPSMNEAEPVSESKIDEGIIEKPIDSGVNIKKEIPAKTVQPLKKQTNVKTPKNTVKVSNTKQQATNSHAPNKKGALLLLGFDSDKYVLNGNEISPVRKKPASIPADILAQRKEQNKQQREIYLNSKDSRIYQYGVDNVDDDMVRRGEYLIGREAAENLYMSKAETYMNTEYARKHKIYNNYKEAPVILKNYMKEKIIGQIGRDKLETTKGIYIDKNSESSKKLAKTLLKHNDFKEKLRKYEQAMYHNFSVNDSIYFKDNNWQNAIGNADIRNMHINKKGDVDLYITDVYDFNDGEQGIVSIGRDRQDKGEIIPYFSIYHVVIPYKDVKESLLDK